jgi:hypothetical protein
MSSNIGSSVGSSSSSNPLTHSVLFSNQGTIPGLGVSAGLTSVLSQSSLLSSSKLADYTGGMNVERGLHSLCHDMQDITAIFSPMSKCVPAFCFGIVFNTISFTHTLSELRSPLAWVAKASFLVLCQLLLVMRAVWACTLLLHKWIHLQQST